jgi:prephenate dehydratase
LVAKKCDLNRMNESSDACVPRADKYPNKNMTKVVSCPTKSIHKQGFYFFVPFETQVEQNESRHVASRRVEKHSLYYCTIQ